MKQDYTYALDAESRLVHAEKADKSRKYFCPLCGEKMVPKQGDIRRWHFAHKANVENCSYETYLHKISKTLLCKAINESKSFYIKFLFKVLCSIEKCPVGIFERCNWSKIREFDLKQYYNHCEEEAKIENYKADLLLKSSEQMNRPPILIEIVVTHKSTEVKLNSKLRIIEIKIDSLEDIDRIISSKCIVESDRPDEFSLVKPKDNIKFHNFKNVLWEEPGIEHQRPKFHFWGDSMGCFRYDDPKESDGNEKCLSPTPPEVENSIFRIDSIHPIDQRFVAYCLSPLGYKSCLICRYCRIDNNYPSPACLANGLNRIQIINISDAVHCHNFQKYDCDYKQIEMYKKYSRVTLKEEEVKKFYFPIQYEEDVKNFCVE